MRIYLFEMKSSLLIPRIIIIAIIIIFIMIIILLLFYAIAARGKDVKLVFKHLC